MTAIKDTNQNEVTYKVVYDKQVIIGYSLVILSFLIIFSIFILDDKGYDFLCYTTSCFFRHIVFNILCLINFILLAITIIVPYLDVIQDIITTTYEIKIDPETKKKTKKIIENKKLDKTPDRIEDFCGGLFITICYLGIFSIIALFAFGNDFKDSSIKMFFRRLFTFFYICKGPDTC